MSSTAAVKSQMTAYGFQKACSISDYEWNAHVGEGMNPVIYLSPTFLPYGSWCHLLPTGTIVASCGGGYATALGGENVQCSCPPDNPEFVGGSCYGPCPEGQFRGKISHQCKPKCPDGMYLSTSGSCKPLPPCPPNMSCLPPDDADPDAGAPRDCSGNPINTATGNKFQVESDLTWGPDLEFVRYYNGTGHTSGGMLKGWRHNFSQRIRPVYLQNYQMALVHDIDPDWESGNVFTPIVSHYVLERPDGSSYKFSVTGAPIDVVPSNIFKMQILSDGFLVQDGLNVEKFDLAGNLKSIERLGVFLVTAQYDSSNLLQSLKDSRGYGLIFDYRAEYIHGVFVKGTPLSVIYANDETYHLTLATYNFGSGINPLYRNYFYDDVNNPDKLTGIYDENRVLFASWTYDSQGRAIESKHAGDVDKVSLTFGVDGTNQYTDETDPLGTTRRSTFKPFGKSLLKSANSQPGGAGCTASSSSLDYDANGNIASTVDFKGNKTTYVFDLTRNLETRRTEAVGAPEQRIIDTQWHPTYRLPTKITESGRTTELTYDNHAHVTLKTVTDTSVTPNVVRSTSYTYVYNADVNNPYVQKLTVDGPRTDVSDVTVYDFDLKGNLSKVTQQATSATTLVTKYENYDAVGRVGTITAPNGKVTQLTYTPRGLLKTRVVGYGSTTPQTTTFDYDNVGNLINVTLPDYSSVNYTYDAAHRLTDIRDGLGNRIHYTLDKAGNRIKEEVTDSSGVLAGLLSQIQLAQVDSALPKAGEGL